MCIFLFLDLLHFIINAMYSGRSRWVVEISTETFFSEFHVIIGWLHENPLLNSSSS